MSVKFADKNFINKKLYTIGNFCKTCAYNIMIDMLMVKPMTQFGRNDESIRMEGEKSRLAAEYRYKGLKMQHFQYWRRAC